MAAEELDSAAKKVADVVQIGDREAARLSRRVFLSVFCEACCCCLTCVPLGLVWMAEVVPDLISRGEYGSALWAALAVFGFFVALFAKLCFGFHGAKSSNAKQLRWYINFVGVSLIPIGFCAWAVLMLGIVAVGMLHAGRPRSTLERYRLHAINSIPFLLMLLVIYCQGMGASAATSLSSHVNTQPPVSPPVAANPVEKAETRFCDSGEADAAAQICGKCGDDEIV